MLYRTLLAIAVFTSSRWESYESSDFRYRALARHPAYGWADILSLPAGLLLAAIASLTIERPEYATALIIASFLASAAVDSTPCHPERGPIGTVP